ncbi:UDP-glycosyltransferase 73C11 [Cryptomeria japonica]|uniref:UDP-glycosyltransferase 73C11 n=1 Tax=Cryptomeria japonica TaxID=3369 RepID=UPI0027DA7160|nr:UDP-glycosyltransferase 73C11 [Cryptomeria japonica]
MQPRQLNDQTLGAQQWLDSQNAGSVLCVSVGDFESEQMAELGFGLEGLERPFLWINNSKVEILEEFRERVRDRGFVISGDSAPPGTVFLPHPSIGGFMTRGGWNSILASIATGVPIITWPVEGDHFSNSVLVAEVLKVGVEICRGYQGFPHRDKLKRAVEQIMGGGGGQAERVRELGDSARKSVSEGGFSTQSIEAFVDEIHKLSSAPELSA